MPKLEILTPTEQAAFDRPPHFSLDEQLKYFQLPEELQDWLNSINNATHEVAFILLWGYGKANARFYQPETFRVEDIAIVCKQRSIDVQLIKFNAYNRRTFNHHKKMIRQHLKLQPFNVSLST